MGSEAEEMCWESVRGKALPTEGVSGGSGRLLPAKRSTADCPSVPGSCCLSSSLARRAWLPVLHPCLTAHLHGHISP